VHPTSCFWRVGYQIPHELTRSIEQGVLNDSRTSSDLETIAFALRQPGRRHGGAPDDRFDATVLLYERPFNVDGISRQDLAITTDAVRDV
jgi:hypothetical protein